MTVNDILNLVIPLEFGSDEDGEETSSMEKVYDQLNESVETAYGASKFVIFLNKDEVIKIPFNGCYWYNYDEKGDCDICFEHFMNEDYCATEEEVYEKAVYEGLEKFFASTKFCGRSKNGVPVYISERVYTFYSNEEAREKTDDFSDNSLEIAKELKSKVPTRLSQEWVARAIEYYGDELVKKLFNFIDKEDISDLHMENVGFRRNGAPVILDYSSYRE